MKMITKIIIAVVVVLAAISIANKIWESTTCSRWNPEKCDYSCSQDSDCRDGNCACINKDESIESCKGLFTTCVGMCEPISCKCVNGRCEKLEMVEVNSI